MSICVLTGDIVGSTNLTKAQLSKLQSVLKACLDALKQDDLASLDIYRGDGWQMDFDNRAPGLREALYIRASLRAENDAFETRIAVACGPEMSILLGNNTETYIASGRALDDMPRDILLSHAAGGPLQAATVLADHLSQGWTRAQAMAIRPFLLKGSGITQKQVANDLTISRQAVGQALDAAGYHVIDRALRAIEEQVE